MGLNSLRRLVIALAQIGRRVVDQVERHPHDGAVGGNVSAIILYTITYALLIAVVVATQSRMGVAASLVGSLVVAVVVATRTLKSWRVLFLVLSIGAVGAIVAPLLFGEALFDRLKITLSTAPTSGAAETRDPSFADDRARRKRAVLCREFLRGEKPPPAPRSV